MAIAQPQLQVKHRTKTLHYPCVIHVNEIGRPEIVRLEGYPLIIDFILSNNGLPRPNVVSVQSYSKEYVDVCSLSRQNKISPPQKTHTHTHTHTHIHTNTHTRARARTHIHIHSYIHIPTDTKPVKTHTHTHTHTHNLSLPRPYIIRGVPMLVPHHMNPLSRGKDIGLPPISGIGYHWQLQKTSNFPGFLRKSSRDSAPKSPRPTKWEHAYDPLCMGKARGGGGRNPTQNCIMKTCHTLDLSSSCIIKWTIDILIFYTYLFIIGSLRLKRKIPHTPIYLSNKMKHENTLPANLHISGTKQNTM